MQLAVAFERDHLDDPTRDPRQKHKWQVEPCMWWEWEWFLVRSTFLESRPVLRSHSMLRPSGARSHRVGL